MAVNPPLNPILMALPLYDSLQGRDRAGVFTAIASGPVRYRTESGNTGYWSEEPTTNHCASPICGGGGTMGWDGVRADLTNPSSDRIRITRNDASSDIRLFSAAVGYSPSVAEGEVTTVSFDLVASSDAQSLSARWQWYPLANGGGTAITTSVVACVSLPDGRMGAVSPAAPVGAASVRFGLQSSGTGVIGEWFEVRRMQFEKKPYATSFCPELLPGGSPAPGYAWISTAHASMSTRAVTSLSMPAASRIQTTKGEFVVRVAKRIKNFTASWAFIHYAISGSITLNTSSSERWRLGLGSSNPSSQATELIASQWCTHFGNWNGDVGNYYQNAVIVDGPDAYTGLGATGAALYLGGDGGPIAINALIGPAIIYDDFLSDARRAMVNAAIDSNGATDLWTLFEEWEGIIQPADLLALQSGQATAGVKAELAPIDLLPLQSGRATAGVTAEVEALELGLMGEPVLALGANAIRVIPLDWDD